MRVRQWIKQLQKDYKPNEALVMGYWDKDFLQGLVSDDEYQLTNDDVLYLAEQDYDWESINDQLSAYIDEIVAENKSEEEIKVDEEQEEELWDTETEKA